MVHSFQSIHLCACKYLKKNSKNLLLVLPAGKAAHIESGIAYGLGKKCYAIGEYEATDTLYNIFDKIFENEVELEEFLKKYSKIYFSEFSRNSSVRKIIFL